MDNEHVLIENRGPGSQDMTGWRLSDQEQHYYFFPTGFILESGNDVRVWTGSGTDTDADLYWGLSNGVWGDRSDTATLWDSTGAVIDSLTWP